MPGRRLVFEAFSTAVVASDQYDSTIYSYRYQNGVRAESISGFSDISRRLEHILMETVYTTEQLSHELSFDRQLLQKILDYLFTHTGEVAALDIPQQPTLYVWSDRAADEATRSIVSLGEVSVYTDDYAIEDLTAVAAYLTNLIVLNPPTELLDDTIEKCEHILDAAKLAQAFQPSAELENRLALLTKKYNRLREPRAQEVEEETEEEDHGDPESVDPDIDTLPEVSQGGKLYPYETLYLLGSGQNYSGPQMLKYISVDDPELTTMSFSNLSTLIVELNTFAQDLQMGTSVLGLVETYIGTLFPSKGLAVRFRKAPGIKRKRNVEKLMHEEMLQIRRRGYRVIE